MAGKKIRAGRGTPKKIHNWKELDGLENENYIVKVDLDLYGGYVRSKTNRKDRLYLSTHFFYKNSGYGDILNTKYGFNVEIIRN